MTSAVTSAVRVVIATAIVIALAGSAVADPDRVAYIARMLDATRQLGATGRANLERDLYLAARTDCHAGAAPSTNCLVDAAKRACKGDYHCELAADAVAANLRATTTWVDQATRARLVRESTDYRTALAAELHKRFGALASELALVDDRTVGTPPLAANTGTDDNRRQAAAIDRLCATRDRTVHACRDGDPTCVPSIPWSRCVAALVWYVGGAP